MVKNKIIGGVLAIFGFVVAFAISSVLVSRPASVEAGASHNVQGSAWSETIGWINFNNSDSSEFGSTDYGVTVAEDGTISGYAWSEHIGWISFNASDVTGCPSGTCAPELNRSSGAVTGWARALAPKGDTDNAGGWDGWISLSGTNYGVTVSSCTWTGWAWGSDVVGWISFNNSEGGTVTGETGSDACVNGGISCGDATIGGNCSLQSHIPAIVPVSGSCIPGYTGTCAYVCKADGNWDEDKGSDKCTLTECNNGIDDDNDSSVDYEGATIDGTTYSGDSGCENINDDSESGVGATPTTLIANPNVVNSGQSSTLTWDGTATGCAITVGGNATSYNSANALGGLIAGTESERSTGNLTGSSIQFNLWCPDGLGAMTYIDSATVQVLGSIHER